MEKVTQADFPCGCSHQSKKCRYNVRFRPKADVRLRWSYNEVDQFLNDHSYARIPCYVVIAVRKVRPSISSVSFNWQDRREVACRSASIDRSVLSIFDIGGNFSIHAGST